MSRYIDADALISILNAKADMALGTPKEVFLSVAKMVEVLPAADVVEVRHAIWNEDGRCSNCDWYMPFDCKGNGVESEYCPYCGAKMDGERREGNDANKARK